MKPDDDDKALSQAYAALEQPLPPPALDSAILAAARNAVQDGAKVIPFPARPRRNWGVPLGLAATVMLALGISLQLRDSEETRLDEPMLAAEMSAPVAVPEAPAAPSADAAVGSKDEKKLESASTAAAAPPPAQEEPVTTSVPATRRSLAQPRQAPPAEMRPAMEPGLMESAEHAAPAALAAPAPAPEPEPAREAESVAGDAMARQDKRSPPILAPAAPAPQAMPAPAPAAAKPAAGRSQEHTAPALRKMLESMPPPTTKPDATPERWITSIRQLLEVGKENEARRQARLLQQRWPDHPLPRELRYLLEDAAQP
ncbi:hypothetical protein [Chitinimonas viridis]|nr:hypothetical protein [Chitinimonas viridis]